MLELEMLIQREIVSQKKKGKKIKAEGTLTFFFYLQIKYTIAQN